MNEWRYIQAGYWITPNGALHVEFERPRLIRRIRRWFSGWTWVDGK